MPYRDMSTYFGTWQISISESTSQRALSQNGTSAAGANMPHFVKRCAGETQSAAPTYLNTLLGWLKSILAVAAMTLLSNLTLSMAHGLKVAISQW